MGLCGYGIRVNIALLLRYLHLWLPRRKKGGHRKFSAMWRNAFCSENGTYFSIIHL